MENSEQFRVEDMNVESMKGERMGGVCVPQMGVPSEVEKQRTLKPYRARSKVFGKVSMKEIKNREGIPF